MRISEFFHLNKTQFELDFVDIPLSTDLLLFIDPYALSKRPDIFSQECSNLVINFFQTVLDDIRVHRNDEAKYKLDKLREPNETRLGSSIKKPNGKGVSGKQSIDIFNSLSGSEAVHTGMISDISDCELVIPNIGRDKISDMVTNIIKTQLFKYTYEQCKTYGIPTQMVSSGLYWNPVSQSWENGFVQLPIYKGTRIILVPKIIVRRSLEYDHQKYYNKFVLEYLQEEHIHAGTGLVHLLKSGIPRVYKKDLKRLPQYQLSKEYLYSFSKEHPEVLRKYIRSLPDNIKPISNYDIEETQRVKQRLDFKKLIESLRKIPPGKKYENDYHNLIIGILEAIFYPQLYAPVKEDSIHNGRKRIDITFTNGSKNGFFNFLVEHVSCPFIITECKNYSEDPANPEIDQVSGRFSPRRGKFGVLVCRSVENRELLMKRCRDACDDDRGYVIFLDDTDLIYLLEKKEVFDEKAINDYLMNKYKSLVM